MKENGEEEFRSGGRTASEVFEISPADTTSWNTKKTDLV